MQLLFFIKISELRTIFAPGLPGIRRRWRRRTSRTSCMRNDPSALDAPDAKLEYPENSFKNILAFNKVSSKILSEIKICVYPFYF